MNTELTARILAAIVGAPIAAFFFGAAIASVPAPQPLAFGVGIQLFVPLWVLLVCLLPLARTGRRAWLSCALIAAPAALVLVVRRWS